jgi:hypothetical protein
MANPQRPDRLASDRFAEAWPRIALIGLFLGAGVGVVALAMRSLNVLKRVGVSTPATQFVAVGVPTVIGAAILGFLLVLLRQRRGLPSVGDASGSDRVGKLRWVAFLAPLVAVTHAGAAFFSGSTQATQATWATMLLATLVPVVPVIVVGFGVVILASAASNVARVRADRRRRRR